MEYAPEAVQIIVDGMRSKNEAVKQRSALEVLKRVLPDIRYNEYTSEHDIAVKYDKDVLRGKMSEADLNDVLECECKIKSTRQLIDMRFEAETYEEALYIKGMNDRIADIEKKYTE
jgi:hypothetical protein